MSQPIDTGREPEEPAPYGGGIRPEAGPSSTATVSGPADPAPAFGPSGPRPQKIRVHHLSRFKRDGQRFAMLTSYDQLSAQIFDQAGIPVLLVGDSAANNVFGYATTVPVTLDELIPLARAVAGAARRALVVADLPFGTYQGNPDQALASAVRMMKEARVEAVKVEGGRKLAPTVELITGAGIPVMAHLGFTPQSEHILGGYRVQGRGDTAEQLLADALALQAAGAFGVVLEMVPAAVASQITKALDIPTIGIGAGPDCDGQVLVWTDMAGLNGGGNAPRFVKRYADLRGELTRAAQEYAADVRGGTFPAAEHTFWE